MIIRKIELDDASSFVSMLHQLDKETEMMMFEPGERKDTPSGMVQTLTRRNENKSLTLGAFDGNSVVGYLVGERGYANRIRNTLYIHLGVLNKYQRIGIARKMLIYLLEFAQMNSYKRLELTVRKDNLAAIKLYLEIGFEVEGVKRSSLLVNDKYIDEYYMSLILK